VQVVLVVEDHELLCKTMCGLLGDLGYETASAHSLAGAREALGSVRPDCVVLDVTLPDGDAQELLRELAGRMAPPPTVVLSAAPRAKNLAARFGVPFVSKPIDDEHLVAAVHVAIDTRSKPIQPRRGAGGP